MGMGVFKSGRALTHMSLQRLCGNSFFKLRKGFAFRTAATQIQNRERFYERAVKKKVLPSRPPAL